MYYDETEFLVLKLVETEKPVAIRMRDIVAILPKDTGTYIHIKGSDVFFEVVEDFYSILNELGDSTEIISEDEDGEDEDEDEY